MRLRTNHRAAHSPITKQTSNAAICRQNRCGHYVAESDTCQLTIDIGAAKGQKRKGKVGYLDSHPGEPCPATPPLFGPGVIGPEILAKFSTPQPDPERRFQVAIKSLLRWDSVERLVRSIKRWYPAVEILIADDSFETLPAELPEAVQRMIVIPGVTWYQVEYDYGLPASRSFLLEQATAPYVINCDDDFVFTEETRVHLLADILDHEPNVTIASGLVRMDGKTAQTWNGHFRFTDEGEKRRLKIVPLETEWKTLGDIWYRRTDLTWNFYAVRRAAMLAKKADPAFKICGEHLDHFLGCQRDGIQVVESPNVISGHLDDKPANYLRMRRRKPQFYDTMLRKWNIVAPPNHHASAAPGIEVRDVQQMVREQHRERPNLVLLTVGHTGSSVASGILGALGWNLGDADDEYGESVSVRSANQNRDWSKASEILAALPEPWVIKDPRFCEHLDRWKPALEPYRPTLVWLTRDEEATAGSFRRRGESLKLLQRRLRTAAKHFERWIGPKLRIDYSQLQAAAGLFRA